MKPAATTKRTIERKGVAYRTHPEAAKSTGRSRAPRVAEVDEHVIRDQFLRLVRARRRQVHRFLKWANRMEAHGESLRWDKRRDIQDARQAAVSFAEPWWGLVVFSCFGSLQAAKAVSGGFHTPVRSSEAHRLLEGFTFPRGSVGHHRIRPGVTGAKVALIAACERAADFEEILLHGDGFHGRYQELRELRAKQWARTTRFDLVLRAGALEIGGSRYAPDRAYLGDSTGPKEGFKNLWGIPVTRQNVEWCEALLSAWTENWWPVTEEVVAEWTGPPYVSGDLENALCVFQEYVRRRRC